LAARFLSAISAAGVNVEVIAQGSTECAITVVVEKNAAKGALRACHTAFFSHTSHMDVILLGCGNVGSVLLQQFQNQHGMLATGHKALHVRAIANSQKLLVGHDTVDLGNWQQDLEEKGTAWSIADIIAIRNQLGLLNPTIIDCSADEGLAKQYVNFLVNGFNVVAANKKANTDSMAYYREMRASAARHFRKFMYETNVGAGLPIIDTLQSLIRSGDELKSFGGILSGSLSMIFGMLEDGVAFSEAVEKAMQLGFTEPDPRDDLSGMDVARKLLIIAREVGLELELEDIEVEPVIENGFAAGANNLELILRLKVLDEAFAARADAAKAEGCVLRYIGRIENGRCSVSVDAVAKDKPLGSIRDGENALVLHSRYYQPIPLVLRGYGAGAEVTAAGVFGDLLRTAWRPLDL
jgi:aspartokinase/homoserine dehydrogenase 1